MGLFGGYDSGLVVWLWMCGKTSLKISRRLERDLHLPIYTNAAQDFWMLTFT
jgi:hypothetical protein